MAKKARKRKKRGVKAWHLLSVLALLVAGLWWVSDRPSQDGRDLQGVSLEELKRRAERGDGTAHMELAERYCEGSSGVPKNVFQCAEWYRKAANGGNGLAMLRLGDLYAAGAGFIQDKEAAAMWWRKAEATADGAAGASKRLRELNAGVGGPR